MNFDESIFQDFTAETKEHIHSMESDLLGLEKAQGGQQNDAIHRVFRSVHSIKGGAGFLGLENIKNVSHVMETLLSYMRNGDLLASTKLIDILLEGVDRIGYLVDDVANSNEVDVSDLVNRLHQTLSQVEKALAGGEKPVQLGASVGVQTTQAAQAQSTPAASEQSSTPQVENTQAQAAHTPQPGSGVFQEFHLAANALAELPAKYQYFYVMRYNLSSLNGTTHPPEALVKDLLGQGQIFDGVLSKSDETPNSTEKLMYSVLYATWLARDFLDVITLIPPQEVTPVSRAELEAAVPSTQPTGNWASAMTPASEQTTSAAPKQEVQAHPAANTPNAPIAFNETLPMTTPNQALEVHTETSTEVDLLKGGGVDKGNTVRINISIIDKLMTLAGELVLLRNQYLRTVDKKDPVSRSIAHGLDIVTTDLQESVMATRMQPMANLFSKFPRLVRDIGHNLGKQIEVDVIGREVELDKTILENLGDPMSHLVRNACDHGLEKPEDRQKNGKNPTGRITLRAYHEGGQINIVVQDDGRGINTAAVRKKALERGLKTNAELTEMDDKAIWNLMFLPGFSTAEQVSDLSGRGVGLDVVKTAINKLGGIIDIDSTPGHGTTFLMRLPLTLAIIPCLVIQTGAERFAIPQINVDELVALYGDDVEKRIEYAGDREVFRLRNRLLPMIRLKEVLAHPQPFNDQTRREIMENARLDLEAKKETSSDNANKVSMSFAVLKVGNNRYGLIVDRILGTEEIVVKPMHQAVKDLNCYAGATVMGDGRVALILDVQGVARHAGIDVDSHGEDVEAEVDNFKKLRNVLLFKSGNKEQLAVPLEVIRRIERIKMNTVERIGPMEFVTIDNQSVRVLRLEKYLSLSTSEDSEEMFLLLPNTTTRYGVLFANLVDVEGISDDLNTQAYQESGVQGSAIVRNSMTLFLDMDQILEMAKGETSPKNIPQLSQWALEKAYQPAQLLEALMQVRQREEAAEGLSRKPQ